MKDYKKEYYEQSVLWDKNYLEDPAENQRIQEIIEIVPPDVHSVLDVGCGNGVLVNTLTSAFPGRFDRVTGLDSSEEALKYVESEKFHGSITNLPFGKQSFDLVTCLEVLEHLPYADFEKGVLELQRVSKKYVIITVPDRENLEYSSVICPVCHCWFNSYFHMRSLNETMLRNLFDNFDLLKLKEVGPVTAFLPQNQIFSALYRIIKRPLHSSHYICPQCGYQNKEGPNSNNPRGKRNISVGFSFSTRRLIKVLWPLKRRAWFLALYKKEGLNE